MQDYFTVTEAAKIKNVNPETVRRWLRTGQIQGERLGGTKSGWCIPRAQIFPENCGIDAKIIELITYIVKDRTIFHQFLQQVLLLLKNTAQDQTKPSLDVNTPEEVHQIIHLCSQLDKEMADNHIFFEKSYQYCQQRYLTK